MAAVAPGGLVGKGRDISLAALQRHDPYINRIVDVASQVALYTFGHRANEWEKTDVEGTLFVYTRSASPEHGFTIMNRLSMENRTEPITKDLDFQLQDPFLLYRNARLSIYGIWFYDKEECQRIAELMKNLTQYEQLKAHQGAGAGVSPMILSSGEGKEVDILQMLTKAKDEYTKCKTCSEPKQITSSSAIYDNPNLIKPIPVKPSSSQQQHIPPGQELLRRLQVVQQEQQLQAAPRPGLAAKFPAVTQSCRTGKPLESWISNTSSTEKQAPLLQVISPLHIPATVAPSLLMSPMVFTQATCAPLRERDGGLLPLQSPEPSVVASSPLTRPQLQEALLYLIQNDDNFLNIIYEAYLLSMTQSAMKKTM
ncbi:mRNA-decapping enzyme 1B isoform X3 [Heterocephalus glaber]|uniref:5'-(N(7)-methylguanosine 5'-triphospho)-[mRNA] hydrolase n=1 Tax=Heterocephalus glaber TaxID=10181 RepID=A0AAX6NVC7_HETGA|nr:mRNA-decapping enzyme 1B isoform X3 [Heterocephalus glaber]